MNLKNELNHYHANKITANKITELQYGATFNRWGSFSEDLINSFKK